MCFAVRGVCVCGSESCFAHGLSRGLHTLYGEACETVGLSV